MAYLVFLANNWWGLVNSNNNLQFNFMALSSQQNSYTVAQLFQLSHLNEKIFP